MSFGAKNSISLSQELTEQLTERNHTQVIVTESSFMEGVKFLAFNNQQGTELKSYQTGGTKPSMRIQSKAIVDEWKEALGIADKSGRFIIRVMITAKRDRMTAAKVVNIEQDYSYSPINAESNPIPLSELSKTSNKKVKYFKQSTPF